MSLALVVKVFIIEPSYDLRSTTIRGFIKQFNYIFLKILILIIVKMIVHCLPVFCLGWGQYVLTGDSLIRLENNRPSTQCLHTITAMGRGPSSILSPKSGIAFPITLEHCNPSHSSRKLINCYSSTHTLPNADFVYMIVLLMSDVICPCDTCCMQM